MPHGEGQSTQQALWLRIVQTSVSGRVVRAFQCIALVLALCVLSWILFIPQSTREQLVLDTVLSFLRHNPPTDVVIAQLSPERLLSVRTRVAAHIGRLLLPMSIAAGLGCLIVAAAVGLVARRIRAQIAPLRIQPLARPRASTSTQVFYYAVTALALGAHLPYALTSIRFDEECAAIYADSTWFAWANNLGGWGNHVAAMFTIRLSTALFGMHELSVRAPAMIASSFALGFLCTYLLRRFSAWVAVITAALFMALPLWAEQTALARGYGLSFSAAALIVVALLRIDEEAGLPGTETMACLFAGIFVGCLAHVFFAFLAIGLFVLGCFSPKLAPAVRPAVLWWVVLAGLVPALSALLGLPGTVALITKIGITPVTAVIERFERELAFRHDDALGGLLMVVSLLSLCGAFIALPRRVRNPLAALAAFAIIGPLLGDPAYVYPRYFLHMLAFAVPCVGWFISAYLLRGHNWANAVLLAAVIGLWASTEPWHLPHFVDLRAAASIARAETKALRERFAVDTYISNGVRFYNGDPGRIENAGHPIPDDVERFLMSIPHERDNIPSGFKIDRRIDGLESDILLLSKAGTSR